MGGALTVLSIPGDDTGWHWDCLCNMCVLTVCLCLSVCLCAVLAPAAHSASSRQSEISAHWPVVLSKLQRDDQQSLGE